MAIVYFKPLLIRSCSRCSDPRSARVIPSAIPPLKGDGGNLVKIVCTAKFPPFPKKQLGFSVKTQALEKQIKWQLSILNHY